MKKREQIIQLSTRIQSLRENLADARQQLADAERELDVLLNGSPTSTESGETLVDRIARILDAKAGSAMTITELQNAVSQMSGEKVAIPSLRSTCARMASDGRIQRLGRGEYMSSRVSPANLVANANAPAVDDIEEPPDLPVDDDDQLDADFDLLTSVSKSA